MDYYTYPLHDLHEELTQRRYDLLGSLAIRDLYWSSYYGRAYEPEQARDLVLSYALHVEQSIERTVARQSIAYWIHIYRRLSPTYPDARPTTTRLVRSILESAFQKYGDRNRCSRIAWSNEVELSDIMRGRFLQCWGDRAKEFNLQNKRQLVLTDFGIEELIELYDVEKLAFEIWRCAATLRIVGKGASLVVRSTAPVFFDDRSEELNDAVTSFDERLGRFQASATGTVFEHIDDHDGRCAFAVYNVDRIAFDALAPIFQHLGDVSPSGGAPNFVWTLFNLRGFALAHAPFADGFAERHSLFLPDVFAVIGAIAWAAMASWRGNGKSMLHHWLRAYEIVTLNHLRLVIKEALPVAMHLLGDSRSPDVVATDKVLGFLALSAHCPREIDVLLHTPKRPLLPFGDDYILDYAWLHELLHGLFYKVKAKDENFKGSALEELVQGDDPPVQSQPITRGDGQQRQVDASFAVGDTLVIAECRVFAMSAGVDRGDFQALRYRQEKINAALAAIDAKAEWLAEVPIGRNYDVSGFTRIIAIVVTPFVEFLPKTSVYWLRDNTPRVMTPDELEKALDRDLFGDLSLRSIPIVPAAPS